MNKILKEAFLSILMIKSITVYGYDMEQNSQSNTATATIKIHDNYDHHDDDRDGPSQHIRLKKRVSQKQEIFPKK
ncbi:hypothetical protein DERP_005893 [Dermatophagoides pteronyssinus]|uniref:Secreted protein n=1 Tax=Dermatophagoides pteronyssinus TaxID=6956 RepID=A0ABQ8JAJ5_DERPT|nr:hypothetical protein DERP_005893 [Dermatophagoides pteronyssinus]